MGTTLSEPYAHLYSDFFKGIDEQGPFYQVQYYFADWADSDAIINQMLGYSQYIGGTTVYNAPHQHPLSPNLFCRSARVIGIGDAVKNSYGYPYFNAGFIVEAVYRTWANNGPFLLGTDPNGWHNIDPDTTVLWCSQELDFLTESITIPNSTLKWKTANTTTEIPVKVDVGITVMKLTFHQLPYLPMTLVREKRGRLNSTSFLGVDRGKCLFVGGSTNREVTTTGDVTQRVTLLFKERDYDWNKYLKPDGITWDFLWDGTNYPYVYTDLNPLVQL
jgi:hypothetical protein